MGLIRAATMHDLPEAGKRLGQFYADIGRPFVLECFISFYGALIEAGIGTLILLIENGQISGGIAGAALPDPHNGLMGAQEFFWYVRKEARGGLGGGRLYWAFEKWALGKGCEEIQMVHLEQSTPGRLEEFYRKQGYARIETRYSKQLLPHFEQREVA